jgi:hypothetical protein
LSGKSKRIEDHASLLAQGPGSRQRTADNQSRLKPLSRPNPPSEFGRQVMLRMLQW